MEVDPFLLVFATPFLGMTANVLLQSALAHLTRRLSLSIMLGVMAGLLVTAALFFAWAPWTGAEFWARMLVALGTYMGFAFCFWATLNLNITSLRIRVLREMLQRPGHTIAEREMQLFYHPTEVTERRIARLLAGGQIRLAEEKTYVLQGRGILRIALLSRVMRAIILPSDKHRL